MLSPGVGRSPERDDPRRFRAADHKLVHVLLTIVWPVLPVKRTDAGAVPSEPVPAA